MVTMSLNELHVNWFKQILISRTWMQFLGNSGVALKNNVTNI